MSITTALSCPKLIGMQIDRAGFLFAETGKPSSSSNMRGLAHSPKFKISNLSVPDFPATPSFTNIHFGIPEILPSVKERVRLH